MNIALLFGGQSFEHEVSLISASFILRDLLALGHRVYPIAISKEGLWQLSELLPQKAQADKELPLICQDYISKEAQGQHRVWTIPSLGLWHDLHRPKRLAVDCAFPIVHGYSGEDGQLQGLLEIAQVPYTGCRVTPSAVGMHKHIVKSLLRQNNLPTTDSVTIYKSSYTSNAEACLTECTEILSFPLIIKPSDGGSSIGVYTANHKEELHTAISQCFAYTSIALVEPYLYPVREIECAVIKKGAAIESFAPGELRVPNAKIYDYEYKYQHSSSTIEIDIPAQLPEAISQHIRLLSEKVFVALDCNGYARIDFFLTEGNTIFINEINTIPGFTAKSMFPLIVRQAMSQSQLVQYLIDSALESTTAN